MLNQLPTLATAALLAALALRPALALATDDKAAPFRERNVAIVVFPDVELLDFAGPGEVFSGTHAKEGHAFHVYTVAVSKGPIVSQGFVTITPEFTLKDCPKPDIVVVPGGHVPIDDLALREWVQARAKDTELMMSVCNGALVYAAAGLLRGLEVTTHHSALQSVALLEPEARVYTNRRFVDNGRVLTAAGIAAGIDGALHVVERFHGEEIAWQTARNMEYDWRPDEIARQHAQPGTPVENSDGLRWVAAVRKQGFERAVADYKKLADPPSEQKLNQWGYTLLNSGNVDAAIDAFRVAATVFPASANSSDSLSEALEAKQDVDGAKQAARESLARLEKDTACPADRRQRLRNSSSSRLARLSGNAASSLRYVCPPCNMSCDKLGYLEAGSCPNCHMQLVERTQ